MKPRRPISACWNVPSSAQSTRRACNNSMHRPIRSSCVKPSIANWPPCGKWPPPSPAARREGRGRLRGGAPPLSRPLPGVSRQPERRKSASVTFLFDLTRYVNVGISRVESGDIGERPAPDLREEPLTDGSQVRPRNSLIYTYVSLRPVSRSVPALSSAVLLLAAGLSASDAMENEADL